MNRQTRRRGKRHRAVLQWLNVNGPWGRFPQRSVAYFGGTNTDHAMVVWGICCNQRCDAGIGPTYAVGIVDQLCTCGHPYQA